MDLLPILLGGCGITRDLTELDGYNIVGSRYRESTTENQGGRAPATRTIVVHSQRVEHPQKWLKCAVMNYSHHTDGIRHEWRLIDGKELYELRSDPGQKLDVAVKNQDVVKRLRDEYEKWWAHVSPRFNEYAGIPLGDEHAPEQELCCHDWHAVDEKSPPWNQSGQDGVAKDPLVNGKWAVEVARPGKYAFTLRMRPARVTYKIPVGKARVKIGDVEAAADIPAPTDSVTLTLNLQPTGHVMLQTWLDEADGKSRGAYYTTVKRIAP